MVTGLPTINTPAYSGRSFSLRVLKQDAYNQTIISDSESVLQVYAASEVGNSAAADGDPAVPTVFGPTIVRLNRGVADFALELKPVFAPLGVGGATLTGPPHLIFEGADAWSGAAMSSGMVSVMVATGRAVCPLGSVLILGPATSSGRGRMGDCVQCGPGTYSIDPLAGITANSSDPACVACPLQALQSGDCAAGGADVRFSLGTWRAVAGLFHLEACPAGYQLINSVDGTFANQIQRCQQCSADQYLLDSTDPSFACQPCPPLAKCNGSAFISRLAGAVWIVSGGKYVLTGCPAGYQLLAVEQNCVLCPTLFFCPGASAPKVACPDGTFAAAGSSSAAACIAVVFVHFSVTLAIPVASFTAETEQSFIVAVAAVAHTIPTHVIIDSVAAARRAALRAARAMEEGSQITVRIAAADQGQAQAMSGYVSGTELDAQLEANGLPRGILSKVRVGDGGTIVSDWAVSATIGVAISGAVVILAFAFVIWIRNRRYESYEERILRLKVCFRMRVF